jgi:DNA-binding CsgD family transcriptional regulator
MYAQQLSLASNIFGKFRVAGRAEAIIRARRWYG